MNRTELASSPQLEPTGGIYAQTDENGIVNAVSHLSGFMIPMKTFDTSVMGCLHLNGEFIPFKIFAALNNDSIVTNVAKVLATNTNNLQEARQIVKEDPTHAVEVTDPSFNFFNAETLIGAEYKNGQFVPVDEQQKKIDALSSKLDALVNALSPK